MLQEWLNQVAFFLSRPLTNRPDRNRGGIVNGIRPNDVVTIVQSTAPDCCERIPGETIAVTLNVELSREDNESECQLEDDCFLAMLRARITWGSGGATFSAECDWLNGTQLCIPTENIRVDCTYLPRSLSCLEPECGGRRARKAPKFDVGALLNYGGRHHNSNSARFTEIACVPEAGGSTRIPIPPYAISFIVVPVGTASQTVRADVYGFGSACRVRYLVNGPLTNAGQVNVESAFPLFNGARFVEISNQDPLAVGTSALVIFGLAL